MVSPDAQNRIKGEERGETADAASQRAQDSKIGTIIAILGVEGVADEASVAGSRPKQSDLPLELDGRSRHQGRTEGNAGVADREPRCKVIATIDDQVMTFQLRFRIAAVQPFLNRFGGNEMVEALDELQSEVSLRIALVPFAKKSLSLKVRGFDNVRIDDGEMSDASSRKRRDDRAPDPARADDRNFGVLQLALPHRSDLRQDNVP